MTATVFPESDAKLGKDCCNNQAYGVEPEGVVDPESRRFLHCSAVLRHDIEYVEYTAKNQRSDEGSIMPISIETPTPSNPATSE